MPGARWKALAGWSDDDHGAALAAYSLTADQLGANWPRPDSSDPRTFFETCFMADLACRAPALITGYYEPVIDGAAAPDSDHRFPLYAPPHDLPAKGPWQTRTEIETEDLLAGRELVWLRSSVEAFFAQVQGSVRVRLTNGSERRFGYAGRNGHPYRSIGAELVRRGAIAEDALSAQAIRQWCAAHPDDVAALLRHNPSFVFFKPIDLPLASGPLGTMGRPVTAHRSIAVDPRFIILGSPVWLVMEGRGTLVIAQDTGSAITGPHRVDLFCGTGEPAEDCAGRMRVSGEIVPLLPAAKGPGA